MSAEKPENIAEEWKKLVEKIDAELRAKGLSDEDRERLLREILAEDTDDADDDDGFED